MQFDLVSDLHIDRWEPDQQVQWQGLGTSLVCVVAGDVSDDLDLTVYELMRISKAYKTVFFVDGNHEHQFSYNKITANEAYLTEKITKLCRNVVYLNRRMATIGDTLFVGTNNWWSFDFGEPRVSKETCIQTFNDVAHKHGIDHTFYNTMNDIAIEHAFFIHACVAKAQRMDHIKKIVVITHTLPHKDLISWGIYPGSDKYVGMYGNSYCEHIRMHDTQNKLHTWVFGHNHDEKDMTIDGVRYVSNPRGRPADMNREVYFPKVITV